MPVKTYYANNDFNDVVFQFLAFPLPMLLSNCVKKLEIVENLSSDRAYATKTGLPFGKS